MANNAALIDELNEEDQRALFAKLSYKFARNKPDVTDSQQRFWDALCSACDITHRLRGDALQHFIGKNGMGRERFDLHVAAFDDFIDTAAGMKLPRIKREALCDLVLECVTSDLRRRDVAITPQTIMNMMAYLPAAVDRSYPGYARARMLHRIVRVV